jgi:hypothetical protein
LCNVKHLYASPSGLFSYQWYLDGKKIIGATTDKYDAYYDGNYTVIYQPDASSCVLSTPAIATTGLYEDPPPSITGTGSPISKLSTAYVGSGFQWYVNDKVIANANSTDLSVYYNGTYYLIASLPNNCQYRSNAIVVNESKYNNLSRVAGMEGDTVHLENHADIVRIFPNPVQEVVKIETGSFTPLGIEFFDTSNRLIYRKQLDNPLPIIQIDVSGWAPGIYLVSLWSDEKRIWQKLIKY